MCFHSTINNNPLSLYNTRMEANHHLILIALTMNLKWARAPRTTQVHLTRGWYDAYLRRCVCVCIPYTHTRTRCRCPTIDNCENRNKCMKKRSASLGVPELRLSGCRPRKKGVLLMFYFYCLQALLFTPLFMYIMTQLSDCGAIELLIINRCMHTHCV